MEAKPPVVPSLVSKIAAAFSEADQGEDRVKALMCVAEMFMASDEIEALLSPHTYFLPMNLECN